MLTTKRKPFVAVMPATWWQTLGFYRFYMLREATAVPAVWFSLELIYGLFALKSGEASWYGFIQFLQDPIVLALNLITLMAALLHTKTWFELAPKATVLIVKSEKVGPAPFIAALWGVTAVVTLVVLAVAFFG